MSAPKGYPIYAVRIPPNQEGCGHQHATPKTAINCALGIMHKRPILSHVDIVSIRKHAVSGDPKVAVMKTIYREEFTEIMKKEKATA